MSIRKRGESVQVFIDSNQIADYDKAMPPAQVFNSMRFFVPGSASELNDKFYIGKIKVSKQ